METVVLNIGGTLFEISKKLLDKYPDTRLSKLRECCSEYRLDKKQYYFDKNPEIFNVILDYYRNDEIHLSGCICPKLFQKELEFWEIEQNIEHCCLHAYLKFETHNQLLDTILGPKNQNNEREGDRPCGIPFCKKIWTIMEEPLSSTTSKIYMVFPLLYFMIILVSTTVILLSSHPNFREKKATFLRNDTETFELLAHSRDHQVKEEVINFITTSSIPILKYLERTADMFFLIEMAIHFAVCPRKKCFFKSILNIIDLLINLAVICKFILEMYLMQVYLSRMLYAIFAGCHVIAIFRLIRVFRIAVQFSGIRILFLSLKDSLKDMLVLVLMLLAMTVLFANLMFYAEFDNLTFPNMFQGMWYAIVTMTTVGYGDIYPVSTLGCIVGSVCALSGIFIMAIPIAIMAGNFTTYYKKHEELKMIRRIEKAKLRHTNIVQNGESTA